jgi:hypothetical protein
MVAPSVLEAVDLMGEQRGSRLSRWMVRLVTNARAQWAKLD